MILTCPECASRYFVDDDRVGPNGRTVRCASCGHSWRATASAPAPSPEAQAPATPSPAFADSTPPSEVADAGGAADRAAPLPSRLRAQAMEKKKVRQAVAAGVAWAGLGAGFVVLILAAALFRIDIVRLWPQTASAYAFARMPVNPTGLAIETVQGQPNLIGGHAALSVTAVERNVETHPRISMPLRVILYDKGGKRLISAVSAPPARDIQPGDTRPFTVNFIDPPSEGSSFVVEFAFDKVKSTPKTPPAAPKAGGAKAPSDKVVARGPEAPASAPLMPIKAENAKPLPSSSPYALPVPAAGQTTH